MRASTRALQALGLLVGLYLLMFAVLAALIGADVLIWPHTASLARVAVPLYFVTAVSALAVVKVVFIPARTRRGKVGGVLITRESEPAFWAHIQGLAAAVGTRGPREIRLISAVNAGVSEQARLLGLLPGPRRMFVGVPLLLALPPEQFDAVLAHELGHYTNRDTRLGGLVQRGRVSVLTAAHFTSDQNAVIAGLFQSYAKLYFSVSESISRRQEFAADVYAARVAGRANAAAALREIPALDQAFAFYLSRYASAGTKLGLLPRPQDLLAGFGALLADPARKAELDEIRAKPQDDQAGKYDSHPPLGQRIAAIEALPDDGRPLAAPDERRAISLLLNSQEALARVAVEMVGEKGADKQAVDWDRLAHAVGLRQAQQGADQLKAAVGALVGREAGLTDLLDLADAGRLDEVLDRLPKGESDFAKKSTGRAGREFAKNTLTDQLVCGVLTALAAQGRARWVISWSELTEVVLDEQLERELDEALDAFTAIHPDAGPLRRLLAGTGAPYAAPARPTVPAQVALPHHAAPVPAVFAPPASPTEPAYAAPTPVPSAPPAQPGFPAPASASEPLGPTTVRIPAQGSAPTDESSTQVSA
ncbi:MAG TPA: M48 family metalloprotease [Actinocrinis sp.]|nr:M48 family metalloprotease [Actinocrinis sp.]